MSGPIALKASIFDWLRNAEHASSSDPSTNFPEQEIDNPVIQSQVYATRESGAYSRHPRRKTREERYATSKSRKPRKANEDLRSQKRGKRQPYQKSVRELWPHSFEFPNIDRDRLTLPHPNVGLFGYGRAFSSQVHMRDTTEQVYEDPHGKWPMRHSCNGLSELDRWEAYQQQDMRHVMDYREIESRASNLCDRAMELSHLVSAKLPHPTQQSPWSDPSRPSKKARYDVRPSLNGRSARWLNFQDRQGAAQMDDVDMPTESVSRYYLTPEQCMATKASQTGDISECKLAYSDQDVLLMDSSPIPAAEAAREIASPISSLLFLSPESLSMSGCIPF